MPGPGYYYNPKVESSFRTQSVPVFKQFFGSSTNRFKNTDRRMVEFANIGPGYINEKEKKVSEAKVPFNSKDNRFRSKKPVVDVPGPG